MIVVWLTVGLGKSGRATKWVTAGLVGVIAMMRKAQNLGAHARAGDLGEINHIWTSARMDCRALRSFSHVQLHLQHATTSLALSQQCRTLEERGAI